MYWSIQKSLTKIIILIINFTDLTEAPEAIIDQTDLHREDDKNCYLLTQHELSRHPMHCSFMECLLGISHTSSRQHYSGIEPVASSSSSQVTAPTNEPSPLHLNKACLEWLIATYLRIFQFCLYLVASHPNIRSFILPQFSYYWLTIAKMLIWFLMKSTILIIGTTSWIRPALLPRRRIVIRNISRTVWQINRILAIIHPQ